MLKKGLEELGFSQEQIERISPLLEKYIYELQLFKQKYNSVLGANTYEEIVSKHIMDSLAPCKIFEKMIEEIKQNKGDEYKIQFADVGTGTGLPGIPLAIAFPEISFTLIERMSKKTIFLETIVSILNLRNVTVKNIELERVPQDSFDVVVFRAFAPFNKKSIRPLLRVLHPDGKLAAYKSVPENITNEMENVKEWAPVWSMEHLDVPYMSGFQRNLVIVPRSK